MQTETIGINVWEYVSERMVAYATQRPYYHLKRDSGEVYMERYWVLPMFLLKPGEPHRGGFEKRFKWLPSIRIHHILSSDIDRHLHDHPSWSISWLLPLQIAIGKAYVEAINRYLEVMPRHSSQPAERDQLPGGQWRRMRNAGDLVFRSATDRHRLEILPGESAWSLFIMGPSRRIWGFHTEAGWVPWFKYVGGPMP